MTTDVNHNTGNSDWKHRNRCPEEEFPFSKTFKSELNKHLSNPISFGPALSQGLN